MTEMAILCVVIACLCIPAFRWLGRVLDSNVRHASSRVAGLSEHVVASREPGADFADVGASVVETEDHDTNGTETGTTDLKKSKAALKDGDDIDPADGLRMVRVDGIPMSMESLRQAVRDGHLPSSALITDADGNEILDENGRPLTVGALSEPLAPDLLSPVNYIDDGGDRSLLRLASLGEAGDDETNATLSSCRDASMGRLCADDYSGNQRPALYDETEGAWYYVADNGEQVEVGAESSYIVEFTDARGLAQQVALHGQEALREWHADHPNANVTRLQMAHPDGTFENRAFGAGDNANRLFAASETDAEVSSLHAGEGRAVQVAVRAPEEHRAVAAASVEDRSRALGQQVGREKHGGQFNVVTFGPDGAVTKSGPISAGEAILFTSSAAGGREAALLYTPPEEKGESGKPFLVDAGPFLEGAHVGVTSERESAPSSFHVAGDPETTFTAANATQRAAFKHGQDYVKGGPSEDRPRIVIVRDQGTPTESRIEIDHVPGYPELNRGFAKTARLLGDFAGSNTVEIVKPDNSTLFAGDDATAFLRGAGEKWVRSEPSEGASAGLGTAEESASPPPMPQPRPWANFIAPSPPRPSPQAFIPSPRRPARPRSTTAGVADAVDDRRTSEPVNLPAARVTDPPPPVHRPRPRPTPNAAGGSPRPERAGRTNASGGGPRLLGFYRHEDDAEEPKQANAQPQPVRESNSIRRFFRRLVLW